MCRTTAFVVDLFFNSFLTDGSLHQYDTNSCVARTHKHTEMSSPHIQPHILIVI